MDVSLAESGRPCEQAWGQASERTRKRMERNLNTPNSAQTKSSSVAIILNRSRQGGRVEGWDRSRVERGLSILRNVEARSAVASPEPKSGQGNKKAKDSSKEIHTQQCWQHKWRFVQGVVRRKKVEVGAYDGFT